MDVDAVGVAQPPPAGNAGDAPSQAAASPTEGLTAAQTRCSSALPVMTLEELPPLGFKGSGGNNDSTISHCASRE
jgi:hypothetical protein